jgi:putative SOS response-associated peptidase YedK
VLQRAGSVPSMCGRYVATTSAEVLAEYFAVDETRAEPPAPSWNVAPTDTVPAVLVRRESRLLGALRWGLVPSWSKSATGAARMINARAETVTTKPAFRAAFERRRCLLPADGFFEWQRGVDGSRQPWYVHRADGAPLAMAGLWEVWRPEHSEAELLRTCAVVTTSANELMAPVHDRMPVLIDPDRWKAWLDPSNSDLDGLRALLVPADPRLLERYTVTTRVNSVRNNDPELLGPCTAADPGSVEAR